MAGELSMVKFAADILFKVFGLKTQQRVAIAEFLAKIADTLSDFGPAFRNNDHEKMVTLASQTEALAQQFVAVTKGVLSKENIDEFVGRLAAAANDKMVLAAGSEQNQQQRLDEIAQVAGMFRGVS
ncbi:MAG: hypothetical protein ACLP56_11130, partial [Candidatus Sulfotelmatobacter sp.]